MPRKMVRTPLNTAKKRASIFKHIQEDLGEESATDESDFQSVSTDNGVTNYDLEYTNRTLRSAEKAKGTSPVKKSSKQTTQPSRKARADTDRSSVVRDKTQPTTSGIRTPRKVHPTSAAANQSKESSLTEQLQQRRSTRIHDTEKSTASSRPGPSKPRREVTGSKKRKAKSPRRKNHILRDIRNMQATSNNLIPKLPFSRVIREAMSYVTDTELRITFDALRALQEAAEIYLTQLFSDAYRCTLHRSRVTLMVKDMELVRYLRGPLDPGNFRRN